LVLTGCRRADRIGRAPAKETIKREIEGRRHVQSMSSNR